MEQDDFRIALPDQVERGDLLVLLLGGDGGAPSDQQAGWTRFAHCFESENKQQECEDRGDDLNGQAFYRLATDQEPEVYSLDSGDAHQAIATLVAFRGAQADDPVFSRAVLGFDDERAESHCPSTAGVRGGVLVCAWVHDDDRLIEEPAGMHMRSRTKARDGALSIATQALDADGPTGRVVARYERGKRADNDLALAIVLRPAQ